MKLLNDYGPTSLNLITLPGTQCNGHGIGARCGRRGYGVRLLPLHVGEDQVSGIARIPLSLLWNLVDERDSNPRPPHCERGITKAKTRRHNQLAFGNGRELPNSPNRLVELLHQPSAHLTYAMWAHPMPHLLGRGDRHFHCVRIRPAPNSLQRKPEYPSRRQRTIVSEFATNRALTSKELVFCEADGRSA